MEEAPPLYDGDLPVGSKVKLSLLDMSLHFYRAYLQAEVA